MIQINSPYSNTFKEEYWDWFKYHYSIDENMKLSEIFIDGEYVLEKDYLLKNVIVSSETYIDISLILKKCSKNKLKLKYDFIDEFKRFTSRNSDKENSMMNAAKLYKEVDINICPYCNLNNISYYKDKHGSKRGHLDHFYCKNDYPYLALSIYNLVPTCGICNSSFKGAKSTNIKNYIHPYFECFNEQGRFILTIGQAINKLEKNILELSNIYITFKYGDKSNKVKNNNKLFHLAFDKEQEIIGVYQQEINYAKKLLIKFRNYPPQNINNLCQAINMIRSKDDIMDDLFGKRIPKEQMVNHAKSKLLSDLYQEYYEEHYQEYFSRSIYT